MIVAESSAASISSKIDDWICCGREGQHDTIRSMADDGCESLPTHFFEFVQTVVQTDLSNGLTHVPKSLPFKELCLGLLETQMGLLIRVSVVRAHPGEPFKSSEFPRQRS